MIKKEVLHNGYDTVASASASMSDMSDKKPGEFLLSTGSSATCMNNHCYCVLCLHPDLKRALSSAEAWSPEPKRRRELAESDVTAETVARIVKTIDEPKKMLGPDVRCSIDFFTIRLMFDRRVVLV